MFPFPENGQYEVTLIVTDNDGATSSTSTIIKVEPFSFAIITDLHIGRGYDDYNSQGFDDSGEGEDYYLTKRLESVVNWIIENKDKIKCENNQICPIKFLVVLGDISDSAERSEFLKAKKILDRLNGYGIPYIPVFGNHDVWPKTEKEEATSTLGESYFSEIFWSENATNTKLMREILGWQKDEINRRFKNFIFNYGGINFIGLDFISRDEKATKRADGILHKVTIDCLRNKLIEFEGKLPVIIFSHHPFAEEGSRKILKAIPFIPFPGSNFNKEEIEILNQILTDYENFAEGRQILANFGGHVHGYEELAGELGTFVHPFLPAVDFDANYEYPKLGEAPVLTTEAIMVGSNHSQPRGIIRIVTLTGADEIDYNNFEINVEGAQHKEFVALNPYFEFDYTGESIGCVFFKADVFTKKKIDSFEWDFGDGEKGKGSSGFHCYSNPGEYFVSLSVKDENGFEETITKRIKIPEKALWPKVVKINIPEKLKQSLEMVSIKLNKLVTEFGRTKKDTILIRTKPHSPSYPIGLITVHFEKATQDIDLSDLVADTNPITKKTILYSSKFSSNNNEIIEPSKVLFVPK